MNLVKALRISSTPSIAFVGAGGKSTAMFQLASTLSRRAEPVIVTATTHLGAWQIQLADHHISAESPAPIEEMEHGLSGITLITGSIENDKISPISKSLLEWLHAYCGYHDLPLLIEADGSRQKPLKAPAQHEPAIPEFVEQVVYVAGLSGLGKPLTEEYVHRPEIFSRLSGLDPGKNITADSIVQVLIHPKGGLKNIPLNVRRCVLLNQAETPELQSIGGKMAGELLEQFNSVTVGTLKHSNLRTFEPNAGIILAAGGSKRYGQPKQLLDWRGQPFVRAVAQTALAAGLSPVVIVSGANAEQVENAVKDLDVKIVRNKDWQSGQGSSVKTGITAITPPHPSPNPQKAISELQKTKLADLGRAPEGQVGSAIFLLADQPQIGADIIHALVEAHVRELSPILAPLVLEERRANPVLFDRVTFPDLLNLEGDVGGRAIFSKYKVEYIPWHDDRLLLDVDEPKDYQRLVEDETL